VFWRFRCENENGIDDMQIIKNIWNVNIPHEF